MKATFETIVIGTNSINYDCFFFCDRFLFAKKQLMPTFTRSLYIYYYKIKIYLRRLEMVSCCYIFCETRKDTEEEYYFHSVSKIEICF